jgi:hypothetical protein
MDFLSFKRLKGRKLISPDNLVIVLKITSDFVLNNYLTIRLQFVKICCLSLSNKKRKIMDETLRFIIGASLFVSVVIFEWLRNRSSKTMFSADTEK